MDYKKMKPIGLVRLMLTDGVITREQAAKYFPELAESEDEKMIGTLIAIFEVNYPGGFYKVNPIGTTNMQGIHSSEIINWLKFLKNRVQPQPKQKWSEEDEYLLDETIKHLEALIRITKKQGSAYSDEIQYYQRDIDWLKSLRPQNWTKEDKERYISCLQRLGTGNPEQPETIWSEEDDQYLLVCKNALAKYQVSDKWDATIISRWLEDKLKSLKERYTWKPSEEMLEALYRVIPENTMEISEDEMLLDKLYQGLKYGRVLSKK